jgi:conserved oligomeric Golgi complex subunit 6
MRAQCDEAQGQLQSTNEACKSLIDRAGSLRDERYGTPSAQLRSSADAKNLETTTEDAFINR